MVLRRKRIGALAATLLLVTVLVLAVAACSDSSTETTATSSGQSTTSSTAQSTTTTEAPKGAANVSATLAQVAEVEQGELTVSKVTVTNDLASDAANALLLTGEPGEKKNVSRAPAAGNEFLLITFTYKKDASYGFRGGLYSDDILLENSSGKEYPLVDTHGYGGIAESNAGKVKPDVEAFTTAVYEVPKGETGLSLIYHKKGIDGFTCKIR